MRGVERRAVPVASSRTQGTPLRSSKATLSPFEPRLSPLAPGLVDPGPVQRLARPELLAGVEVEPALPARLLRPRVPGDPQRLHSPVGKGDQVLLQRVDAEDEGDLEVGEPAVRAVGVDEEPAVAAKEAAGDVAVGEGGAFEVAEHRGFGGLGHGQVVVGAAPGLGLRRMAAGADRCADERGLGRAGRSGLRRKSGQGQEPAAEHKADDASGLFNVMAVLVTAIHAFDWTPGTSPGVTMRGLYRAMP